MINKIFAAIAILCSVILAETHIAGDIHKMVFDVSGNPYIVEQDIIIPAQQEVVFKAGCIFLFKPFAGLHILGKLTADGTEANPVVFTSINDGDYNTASKQLANPFDWNGLLVGRESTGANFKNILLRFSVYGIKSQNPNVIIQNGKFRSNGQFHFTINDKIQMVQDDLPYTYGTTESNTNSNANKQNSTEPLKQTQKSGQKNPEAGKLALRYTGLGVGVVGLAVGGIYSVKAGSNYSKLTAVTDSLANAKKVPNNSFNIARYTTRFNVLTKEYQDDLTPAIIFGVLGVLGLTGFTLTFVF